MNKKKNKEACKDYQEILKALDFFPPEMYGELARLLNCMAAISGHKHPLNRKKEQ